MFEVVEIGGTKTVSTKAACNHVYVVDVSGSMYSDLAKIRQNMKNIISMVAQPDDTFSVIYFSGKGQCGVVFENVLVSDHSTVELMHKSIDRYIQAIGLTGFVDPMDKAMSLSLDSTKLNNLVFMTDGYDNQSNRTVVVEKAAKLAEVFQSVTFIEYGYYADRDLIAKMAEAAGGNHIFADNITKYETLIDEVITGVARVQNITVPVNKAAKHGIYVYNGQIRIANVEDGAVSVPEDTECVYSIIPRDVLKKNLSEEHLYLILYYAVKTSNDDLVWDVLKATGDVRLIRAYTNTFTKQEMSSFEANACGAALNESERYVDGKDLNLVPDDNASTIIDLLQHLSDSNAKLVVDSPFWNYKRIGRASKAQDELPRFIKSPMAQVAMNSLVFNSERPNVSISTNQRGSVELPVNEFGLKHVPSFVTRNYSIIKDGIVNVRELPVVVENKHMHYFDAFPHKVISEEDDTSFIVFDLTKIPVVNRSMVAGVSKGFFVRAIADLTDCQATLKVAKNGLSSTGKADGLAAEYGEEAAKWLTSIGVRYYGFSPVGTKSEEATDEYESIQVVSKIKGLSSLPSINAVEKKVAENKKLNIADALLKSKMDKLVEYCEADLKSLVEFETTRKRDYEYAIAREVYALVLGRRWYGDEDVVEDIVDFGDVGTAPITIHKLRKMIAI